MYYTKRKRVIKLPNREVDFGTWDLRDFIAPRCYATVAVFAHAWGRYSELYAKNPDYMCKVEKLIGLDNIIIKEMWNVVNVMIKYRGDDPIFQTPDFWQLPNETWGMGKGDCEDSTFLLVSAIRGFKPDAKVYATLGLYIDPYTKNVYGHAWGIYKARFYNGWLWLESTLENALSQSVWLAWNPEYLVPVYWFNECEAYRVDRDYRFLGLDEKYVEKHRGLIEQMIDYVETGKWTKVKWMHKGRRVPVLLSTLVVPVA